ncbi:MAG: hypothetical protein AAF515_02000 [Pseudomonadota bacterium]
MPKSPKTERHYCVSPDPIIDEEYGQESVKDIRLAVYNSSVAVWKELAAVRFKLVALLPAISVAVLVAVVTDSKEFEKSREFGKLGIVIFGFVVSLALYLYDKRNSQLYDELISRSRRAEMELGVHTGAFLGRPRSKRPLIKHDVALDMIYVSCLLAWAGAAALILIGLQ